jgi:hypothetical protein
MFGIDEIYDSLLLEAKSPEEIKKILEYQFVQGKGVPQEILDGIFNIDPTKKKSYTKWTLIHWSTDADAIQEALKNGKLAKLFKYAQERAGNGFSLVETNSFEEAMNMLPEEVELLEKDGDGPENDFDVVYDTPEWKIAVPHTYEADKKLGEGCKWCTAGAFGDNDGYWKRYSAAGPLYVNFDMRGKEICPMNKKEYPFKRYQFLFEWDNFHGELMDCHDDRVNFEKIDMPQEVVEFYRNEDERYAKVIENNASEADIEARQTEYENARREQGSEVKTYEGHTLLLLPEEDEDYEIRPNCYYYLYDEEDWSDPVAWFTVDPNDFIVNNFGNLPYILVKGSGRYDRNTILLHYDEGDEQWEDKTDDIIFKNVECGGTYFVDLQGVDAFLTFYPDIYQDNDYLCIDFEYLWIDTFENVSKVHKLADGLYAFDIEDENNVHTLVCGKTRGSYGGSTYTVIRKDFPINGLYFEIKEDENGLYTEGKFNGKVRISENTEDKKEDAQLSITGTRFSRDLQLYEVQVGKHNLYNIYDSETKRLLLQENYERFEDVTGSILCLTYPGSEKQLYDYVMQNYLTPKLNSFSSYSDFGIVTATLAENPKQKMIYSISEDGDFNLVTTIDDVKWEGFLRSDYGYLFLETSNGYKIFNMRKRELFKEDLKPLKAVQHSPLVVIATDNSKAIFNLDTQKIVFDGVDVTNYSISIYGTEGAVLCNTTDGKNAIVGPNGLLFPVGSLRKLPGGDVNALIYANGPKINKIIFINPKGKLEFWPSKDGVIFGNDVTVRIPTDGGVKVYLNDSKISNNPTLPIENTQSFEFYPFTDKIITNPPDSKELLNKAKQILYPQSSQISENFMNLYKRMINTEK